jgi:hypothetical protein
LSCHRSAPPRHERPILLESTGALRNPEVRSNRALPEAAACDDNSLWNQDDKTPDAATMPNHQQFVNPSTIVGHPELAQNQAFGVCGLCIPGCRIIQPQPGIASSAFHQGLQLLLRAVKRRVRSGLVLLAIGMPNIRSSQARPGGENSYLHTRVTVTAAMYQSDQDQGAVPRIPCIDHDRNGFSSVPPPGHVES